MTDPTPRFDGHYPGRVAIDAYGNGGFRFSGMSHRGGLIILADGMSAWTLADVDIENADGNLAYALSLEALAPILARLALPEFLLLGTGRTQIFPKANVRRAFIDAQIGLDVMDTGAAARTYNILLAEKRPVAAVLLPVD
jgi:uncharacterized protein